MTSVDRLKSMQTDEVLRIYSTVPERLSTSEIELHRLLHGTSDDDLVEWFYSDFDWALEIIAIRYYPLVYARESIESVQPKADDLARISEMTEVAQEVLIRVLHTRRTDKGRYGRKDGRFSAWLRTIERNVRRDIRRAQYKYGEKFQSLEDPVDEVTTRGDLLPAQNCEGEKDLTIEGLLIESKNNEALTEFFAVVRDCATNVNGRPGEVIRLVADGLGSPEIAAKIGIDSNNVYIQRYRGCESIRRRLRERGYEVVADCARDGRFICRFGSGGHNWYVYRIRQDKIEVANV